MSDQFPPDGDEPTQAWRPPQGGRPWEEESEPTRMERPVPAYDPAREEVVGAAPYRSTIIEEEPDRRGIVAQLVTVGLLCTLLGLGLGYLLFHDSGGGSSTPDTTTTSQVATTTTVKSTTTTEEPTTSTTRRSTTTTTARSSSSTTVRTGSTTTVAPG